MTVAAPDAYTATVAAPDAVTAVVVAVTAVVVAATADGTWGEAEEPLPGPSTVG